MSPPRQTNTFRMLSRSVGHPLGAFHRSNAALIVAALLIHCGSLAAVWNGEEAALALALVGGLSMVGLIGMVAAVGTIRHQTKEAKRRGGWDELLVTPLTDREIVNGQLMLAMRPYFSLVWLALPSPVVLIALLSVAALDELPTVRAVDAIAAMILSSIAILIGLGLVMYIVCIGALLRAFAPRRHLGQVFLSLIRVVFSFAVIALITIFIFPFAWVALVGLAWLEHRTLCCSVRNYLLSES